MLCRHPSRGLHRSSLWNHGRGAYLAEIRRLSPQGGAG
jgi:hypothetical protein